MTARLSSEYKLSSSLEEAIKGLLQKLPHIIAIGYCDPRKQHTAFLMRLPHYLNLRASFNKNSCTF